MFQELITVSYCYNFLIEQISMELLLYSHLPAALFALFFSAFVFIKTRNKPALLLLLTCCMFALWSVFDLGAWFAFMGSYSSMFTWSLLDFFAVCMFFLCYYFLYTFTEKKDLPLWQKIFFFIIILPVALISVAGLNIPVYDLNSCAAWENSTYTRYTYFVESIILLAVIAATFFHLKKNTDKLSRQQSILSAVGVLIFLLFFYSASFSVSLLAATDASTYVYNYLIYGLIGMPIFLVFLGYLVVRYQAFNLKLLGAQALTVGLVAITGSQFFFANSVVITVLVTITFILVSIGGWLLMRSVKQEVRQREQIEKLAKNLEKANKRLKVLDQMKSEFVSIASHQLRSPLTSIRGYASMLLEGSYGTLSDKAKEAVERISDSSGMMASSVEDYLNVSRIQAGNMKYEYSDFNLVDTTSGIVDDKRREAVRKGLVLSFKSDMQKQGIVHADKGKTMQIIHNLINNSLKYTPKGTITVFTHDKGKRIFLDVVDTGIGMSADTIENIFAKFERAKNANEVNVTGTGLGLYVAQKMAKEMGGDIEAFSDGEGEGSTFRLTLPLEM